MSGAAASLAGTLVWRFRTGGPVRSVGALVGGTLARELAHSTVGGGDGEWCAWRCAQCVSMVIEQICCCVNGVLFVGWWWLWKRAWWRRRQWRTCVCVCVPELVGAGRRVEYYVAASRQAVPKQAGEQASKRAKARQGMNEWIEGILWLGIVAQSRMYVRRGC